ncbi:TorD/DmsD family molecular chaperone [Arcobacter vandammei]|uniref:TorD/DmsD family molecular chaperone n=1 Tax=Arcobacter vandammei TaxID=2782243 RepID=UPI0018DF954B|nr:molecular chaperone TorD family protein [Arcobacter vandammei]
MQNIQTNQARLFVYNLLSLFFIEEYTKTKQDEIVKNLEILSQNAFSPIVEKACIEILEFLKQKEQNEIFNHYQELFLIPFGECVPISVSWYHEQREGGIMQLKVKDVLAKTKIRKDENSFTAQEDHLGFIFTLCAYLLEQQLNEEIKEDLQKELFVEVLSPYIDKFFYRLMAAKSPIYSNVGLIVESFYEFEKAYIES